MKTRKIMVEVICLVLMINFFYEGMYKLVYIHSYGQWLKYAPFLEFISTPFTFAIPVGEILLSILFIYSRTRILALNICMICEVLFVLWVMSVCLFSHSLFWPYHTLWKNPVWIQKIIVSLFLSWLSFFSILLSRHDSIQSRQIKSLRNKPVTAR